MTITGGNGWLQCSCGELYSVRTGMPLYGLPLLGPPSPGDELIPTGDAVTYSGIEASSLRRFYRLGQIRGEMRGGRMYLRRKDLVLAHIHTRQWREYRERWAITREAWRRWAEHVSSCRALCPAAYLAEWSLDRVEDLDPPGDRDAYCLDYEEQGVIPDELYPGELPNAEAQLRRLIAEMRCPRGRGLYALAQSAEEEMGGPPARSYTADLLPALGGAVADGASR